ncbi:MAG: type II secretion system protein [Gemmatimonadaceae bacterium]
MRTHTHAPRRRGFTLIELMIVVSLLGIIGTMLTTLLVRQQRFHRAVTGVTDARARMRDIATILPTDLRSVSTAGDDILDISDTSIQFRAFIGTAVLCKWATADAVTPAVIDLPPKILQSGNVLTSWINPPAPDDIAYVYDDGTKAGNFDDTWVPVRISDTTSAANSTWCPSTNSPQYARAADDGAVRYRITLATAPSQARVSVGSPIRFAREVRYSIYEASDSKWYVGFQRCTPNATYGQLGSCGTREVLAGPVLAGTADTLTSGLFFVYYNKSGTRLTALSATDTIARVSVGVRTTSESLLKATTKIGGSITGGDSIRFTVGIRNRI